MARVKTSLIEVDPGLLEFLEGHPEAAALLQALKEHRISPSRIRELTRQLGGSQIKAIILAAGMGTRMGSLTQDLPKCLAIVFNDKTLLEQQMEVLRSCGIDRMAVVRGYQAKKIKQTGVTYYANPDYAKTNILHSLFCAEPALEGDVLVSYSDIWYESAVVERLLRCEQDIAIGIDIDWKEYYYMRKDHPIEEAENVIFNSKNEVVKIGKIAAEKEEVHGEFIGMMKLTERGCQLLKRHYHRTKALYQGQPFHRAASFDQAYLTDLLQEMADSGVSIHCEIIGSGWKEIDTVEDLEKAVAVFEGNQSNRRKSTARRRKTK